MFWGLERSGPGGLAWPVQDSVIFRDSEAYGNKGLARFMGHPVPSIKIHLKRVYLYSIYFVFQVIYHLAGAIRESVASIDISKLRESSDSIDISDSIA